MSNAWAVRKLYERGTYALFYNDPKQPGRTRRVDDGMGGFSEQDAKRIANTNVMLAALQEIARNDPYGQSAAGVIARAALARTDGSAA